MKPFKDRYGPWALVTGATSGIGRATAERLARQGLNLLLVGRNAAGLEECHKAWSRRDGVEIKTLVVDLETESSRETIASACQGLDIGLVVACAGFGFVGSFHELSADGDRAMLAVNARAVIDVIHLLLPHMVAQRRGGLVLASSIVAFQGAPYSAHYAATKAYIQTLAEGLAVELRPHGVDVLSIAPGPTRTGFAARAGMTMAQAATPDTVAKAIVAKLGRRTTVLPGVLAKLLGYSLATLPRWAATRVMGKVMAGMMKRPGNRDGNPV